MPHFSSTIDKRSIIGDLLIDMNGPSQVLCWLWHKSLVILLACLLSPFVLVEIGGTSKLIFGRHLAK